MTSEHDNILKEVLLVFFGNLRLFKQVAFVGIVLTLSVVLFVPPNYNIGGSLVVDAKRLNSTPGDLEMSGSGRPYYPAQPQDVETEATVARSPQFLRYAAQRLRAQGLAPHVEESWFSQNVTAPISGALKSILSGDDSEEEDNLWRTLEAALKIQALPGSSVVEVGYYTRFPHEDLPIARSVMESFLMYRITPNTGQMLPEFYREKIEEYRKRLAEIQEEKLALLKKAAFAGTIATEVERLVARGNDLEVKIEDMIRERELTLTWAAYIGTMITELSSRRKDAASAGMPPFPLEFESVQMSEINLTLVRQLIEHIKVSSQFDEGFAAVQQSKEAQNSLEDYILLIAGNEREMKLARIEALSGQIKLMTEEARGIQETVANLKDASPVVEILNAEIESIQETVRVFQRRLYESTLDIDGGQVQMSNVRIASMPYVPAQPSFPVPQKVIPIGFIVAILLGVVAVFIRNFFSRTFSSPQHISKVLGLPIIASTPDATAKPVYLKDLFNPMTIFSFKGDA